MSHYNHESRRNYKSTHIHDANVFSVYVSNLPVKTKRNDLLDLFKQCGSIDECYVAHPNSCDANSSVYGFVRFHEVSSATQAVREMEGWPVMGHRIRVEISDFTLSEIKRREGVELNRKGEMKPNPDAARNYHSLIQVIEEMNQESGQGDVVNGNALFSALGSENLLPIPMFRPHDLEPPVDPNELDALMQEELKQSCWHKSLKIDHDADALKAASLDEC